VLSGGGAKGIAHIGVLKYLEENKIPVHYIVGTSMGGLVGGYYSSGYSPTQMESIANSPEFNNWSTGRIEDKYNNYYLRKEENSSLLSLSFNIDTTLKPSIKPVLVSDAPLNLAISRYTARTTSVTENFDSLVVPFRCIAADVYSQTKIILKNGNLGEAMRATMSVPLVFKPFKLNGKYLYDGGIYNNFPVDVAIDEFKPDFIIGVNVSSKTFSEYPVDLDESIVSQSLIYMLFAKSDSTLLKDKGVYIQPNLKAFSTFDFNATQLLIQAGYNEAKKRLQPFLKELRDSVGFEQMLERRSLFMAQSVPNQFDEIKIVGLKKRQEAFVYNTLREKKKLLSLDRFTMRYYRLVQDGNFNVQFPLIKWNPTTQLYDLEMKMSRDRRLDIELGGNIATRAIQQLYLGYSYSFINRLSFQVYGNFYTGRFYHSAQGKMRIILPTVKQPIYFEPEITWNQWDYLRMNEIILSDNIPTYIRQSDLKAGLTLGMPWRSRTRILAQGAYFNHFDKYLNNYKLNNKDTLDVTLNEGAFAGLTLDKYDLDKKMYPTKGMAYSISTKFIFANEEHNPGTSSYFMDNYRAYHQWARIKLKYEHYLTFFKWYSIGYMTEGMFSTQPTFRNYTSTLIAAPAFNPMTDSKTLFLENYRAFYYLAGGIKNIFKLNTKLHLRAEGFIFQRYNKLEQLPDQTASTTLVLDKIRFCGDLNLVYHTPFGPVSLSGIYYDDPRRTFGVLLHVGYILFNNRPLD
jgi:NTE family protein